MVQTKLKGGRIQDTTTYCRNVLYFVKTHGGNLRSGEHMSKKGEAVNRTSEQRK